ncbi:cellulose-binding family ii [Phlyctema vagabunda]|uniref:Cellulose-binding family ii n=1 Tax=Phlyctema vagabunda TaxID=108571 RepID=A0ABR4P496_9HELO
MRSFAMLLPLGLATLATASLAKRETTWNPPSDLVKPLADVWNHTTATFANGDYLSFKNSGYDIIMAGKGKLNYCVRWDDDTSVTEAQRTAIATSLQVNVKLWTDHLTGFMGWPYDNVSVSVVGWATKDKSTIEGSTTGLDIYTTVDGSGVPECDPRCGRFYHQDGDYSTCPGGADRHYDVSLWLTKGWMEGGAGGDWGERMATSEYVDNMNSQPEYFLHEFGHTLALLDFYDWMPTGQSEGESFIMNGYAPTGTKITDFDIWMMRDWWRHLSASRYAASTTTTTKTRKLKSRQLGSFE